MRRSMLGSLALALVVPVVAVSASTDATAAKPTAKPEKGYTFAVIGDIPYGEEQIVGSNNSLASWTGNSTATPEQGAGVDNYLKVTISPKSTDVLSCVRVPFER
jgi:hypothetical protein